MTHDSPPDILSGVKSPLDIKALSEEELVQLAGELRERIIDVVSFRGGHLASSLGVVELTLALHKVYNAPDDKIIWDVGHQCYAHKIITGRNDSFGSMRTEGGISGFPRREESKYDPFTTGHAGTSISAALGMARARDYLKKDNKVIAVIGDGSLTAGLAFEGLNHAGSLHTNFTVVLNDNKMSISHNVGALSQYLNRIITGKWYNRFRKEVDPIVESILGDTVSQFVRRIEGGIKGAIVPGRLFEDLGFKYIGPIEGHELSYLIETFEAVKEMKGPKLVHVVTTKGKGYSPAEKKAHSFHGVSPFHRDTGAARKNKSALTYTEAFSNTLIDLAEKDDRIVGITAAMQEGTGLLAFAEKFPDRFYDVGIAEPHAATFAAGLATEGLKPVVAIYSTFLQRVFDQIIHDVCLMELDVTFAVDRAGIVGEDGATHQGLYDLTYLRCAPNIVVMAPKDENELRHMLKTAISYNGPAAVRYPRGVGVGVEFDDTVENLPIGKGELLKDGDDLCIIAIGNMVTPSVEAAKALEEKGFDVAVVNARFVKPLDEELLVRMANQCGLLVTVEENALAGGFGSAVLEALEQDGTTKAAIHRIGIDDIFVDHSSQKESRARLGLDRKGIIAQTLKFLKDNGVKPKTDSARYPVDAKKKAVGS